MTPSPFTPMVSLRAFALLAAICAESFSSENFTVLPTELKVSSVGVSVRAPLGFKYRPGEAFPLELHVANPGPAMDVEITAIECSDTNSLSDWAERAVLPHAVPLPTGTSRFMLPMRAPGVSAAIVLNIRGGTEGSGKAELFRASLSRALHPLSSVGRVVVFCGGGLATVWPQDQAARLNPRELPAEAWMWESVDWVVLSDAAINDAPPVALAALRNWLLGGGRLFLRTREALAAAFNARLMPIEVSGDIPADFNWWEKNAGLRNDDVLATKNFRPVYARLRRGFGQVVFLFPGSQAADADEAAVFNRSELQRHREARPDRRVQPERFAAFVPAAPSEPRRRSVMFWAVLGALIFCAGLFFARSSRSKIEAALLPLGAGALLTALVANGFPQHELTISRVILERRSADDLATVQEEWAYLEAFRRPIEVTARGSRNGTLAPRFDELDDLRSARMDRSVQLESLALEKIGVAPHQPAMLYANAFGSWRSPTDTRGKKVLRVLNPAKELSVSAEAFSNIDARRAIWIQANGVALLLQKSLSSDECTSEAFTPRALEMALAEASDMARAKANAVALSWAVDEAIGQGGGALIVWNSSLRPNDAPLISIRGAAANAGNDLFVRTIGLRD